MMITMKTVKQHLTLLGIDFKDHVTPLPCFSELRKAFRAHLMLHPDKGGDTDHFQKLTHAVREVMEYSVKYPDKVKSTPDLDSKPDKVLLEAFETKHLITFNQDCVVVSIEENMEDKWTRSFDEYFSIPKQEAQDGFIYREPLWQAPGTNIEPGLVQVYMYPTSKAGPKFMVQGKLGLVFVNTTLSMISETLGKSVPEIKQIFKNGEEVKEEETLEEVESLEEEKTLEGDETVAEVTKATNEASSNSVTETHETTKSAKSSMPAETIESDDTTEDSDANSMISRIDRMQKCFISSFSNLEAQLKTSLDNQRHLETKVETLTTEVKSFKDKVNTAVPIPTVPTPIGEDVMKKMARSIETISSKVDTSKHETNTKIEQVKETIKEVETNVITTMKGLVEKKDEQIKTGWEEHKVKIASMHTAVDSLMVRVTEMYSLVRRPPPFSVLLPSTLEDEDEDEDKDEAMVVKVRKGIVFADSIGKDIDVERFEMSTNSKIEVIPTYRILDNDIAPDPNLHLENMIEQHMKKEHHFAVFMVGANDVTDMNKSIGEMNKTELMKLCDDQTTKLLNIATKAAHSYSAEVFVSEMVPRYDCPKLEQFSKLSTSQLVVKAASAPTERVHVVGQGGLMCAPGRRREDLYRDGLHLTSKGLYNASTNIIQVLQEVYQDLRDLPHHPSKVTAPKVDKGGARPQHKPKVTLAQPPLYSHPPPSYTKQGGPRGPAEEGQQSPPPRGGLQPGRAPHLSGQRPHLHSKTQKSGNQKPYQGKVQQKRSSPSHLYWECEDQQQAWAPEDLAKYQEQEQYYTDNGGTYGGPNQALGQPQQYWDLGGYVPQQQQYWNQGGQVQHQQYNQGWQGSQYYGGQY